VITLLFPLIFAANPSVRLTADSPPVVEVVGVPASELKALELRVTVADAADAPPLAGTTTVGDTLRFAPRFPLVPGVKYRASFARNGATTTAELVVPKPPAPPPACVTAVYPSAATLPENALRLYVQFSAPMTRGDSYPHVKLLDAAGKEVPAPFLELGEELWSADGTRFTLLFDPARVKRGLVPHEEDGPVLVAGRRYTLVVDRAWRDEHGTPLRAGYRKEFAAGPADAEPVDLGAWAVTPPAAGSTQPVVVKLPKPLDRALLHRLVWVADADGKKLAGTLGVGGSERVVTFAPARSWPAGRYQVVADARLEDPCGNRVGEPFEVDGFPPVRDQLVPATASRWFAVK
jgi:hypothetical protein